MTKHTPYLHSEEDEKHFWHVDDVDVKRQSVMVSHAQTVETKASSVMVKIVAILVELLTDDGKDKDSPGGYLERGHPARMGRGSSLATRRPPVDQALNTSSYQNWYTPRFRGLDVSHAERSESRGAHADLAYARSAATTLAPASSSVVATLSKKSFITASRATDLRPDTAPMTPQDFQAVLPRPDEQLWRHTTDAYQEVSGPSNMRKRSFGAMTTTQEHHHQRATRQYGYDFPSGNHEAVPSGQDESSPESDGDTSDHIRIAF
ncbi:hypothetical protein M436DRAFT_60185 [Aureobasidium namibiae CBS 147.97]|uniref:Uncharacterized protein n=1 Tax=Aureobasidium namibiae CBS 147.97 TaxID=1043004 RepID=A0A074WYL8_9PEZI